MREQKTNDAALLILRLVAGGLLIFYGADKLFGVISGQGGFSATLSGFQTRLGIPPVLGALAIFAEFFGGLGLLLGLLARAAAFGVLCTMLVAAFTHFHAWKAAFGTGAFLPELGQAGFPLTLGAIALTILLCGAGKFSLDQKFWGRRR